MKNEVKVILEVCSEVSGSNKLTHKSRAQDDVMGRYVAMYILRNFMYLKLSAIGKIFNRDHTSVLHGLRTSQNLIDTEDPIYCRLLAQVKGDDRMRRILYPTDRCVKIMLPAFISEHEVLDHIRQKFPDCELV